MQAERSEVKLDQGLYVLEWGSGRSEMIDEPERMHLKVMVKEVEEIEGHAASTSWGSIRRRLEEEKWSMVRRMKG